MPRASNIHRLFSGKRFSTYLGSARNRSTRRLRYLDPRQVAGWTVATVWFIALLICR